MKHKSFSFFALVVVVTAGCKSNPPKTEAIQTEVARTDVAQTEITPTQEISGPPSVPVQDEELIAVDKTPVTERLRDLQNSVYALEDRVYGTRKLGGLGLYGELKSCLRKMASAQYGGTGSMIWSEPLDRVTDKEEEIKAGPGEGPKDRLQRFQSYRSILRKRSDEFSARIEACNNELAGKTMDAEQPTKVMVSEVPKTSLERAAINKYLCGFVQPGASLRAFMLNAFAQGWLSLSDYKLSQNLIAYSLKDAKDVSRDNALLFNGWRLAFDRKQVTIGELFNDGKDAKLTHWAFDRKSDIEDSTSCLKNPDGHWNP